MSCLAMTSSGDLDISTGNLRIEQDNDKVTAIKLTNRLKLFLGEWFLDKRIGVPYYKIVFVKNPNLQTIAQMFKRIMLQTPNVANVLEENIDFISSQRAMFATFKVQTVSGAILEGGPGLPFIVVLNGTGKS